MIEFDPVKPEFLTDPYPVLREMQLKEPVYWSPKGYWVLTRQKDVLAAFSDDRFSNSPAPFALVHSRNRDRYLAAAVANNLIAFKDHAEHADKRRVIARCFRQRLTGWSYSLGELSEYLVEDLVHSGPVDLVQQFAVPLAGRAAVDFMGFEPADAKQIANWSDDFFRLFHASESKQAFERLNGSLAEFRTYVGRAFDEPNRCSDDGLISLFIEAAKHNLSRDEAIDNAMLLTADAIGNVAAGLANCISVLCDRDDCRNLDAMSSKDLASVVHECLRLESPSMHQGRIVSETVTIDGRSIRAYSIVLLHLAAANRDPEIFDRPDEFVLGRKGADHVTFGYGNHFCMGGVLAQKVICAGLTSVFSQNRRVSLVNQRRDWLVRPGHRWLKSLGASITNTKDS